MLLAPFESRLACLALLACSTLALDGIQADRPPAKQLVGVTTGNTQVPAGQIVSLDPASGKTQVVADIVSSGGQGQAADVLLLPEKKGLLVALVEVGERRSQTVLARVEYATGKRLHESKPFPGALDALCLDPQGVLLATLGQSRPQKLVTVDLAQESTTEVGALDKRLWIRSLAYDAQGALWGLHTRTPELDVDALVRLDRASGALLETVKLDLPTLALALEIDEGGRMLVTADHERLHEVDPKTGKSVRSVETGAVRIVGLDRAR